MCALSVEPPHTAFMSAVLELLRRLDATVPAAFQGRIKAVLVGGAAVHVYTAWRVSHDVEAIFDHRLLLPPNLVVRAAESSGEEMAVSLDTNYASEIALLHPDAMEDSLFLKRVARLDVHVLSPTDLAVTKVGRWLGNDAEDLRELAKAGYLDADRLERRVRDALAYFVGATQMVEFNLRDALEIVRTWTPRSSSET